MSFRPRSAPQAPLARGESTPQTPSLARVKAAQKDASSLPRVLPGAAKPIVETGYGIESIEQSLEGHVVGNRRPQLRMVLLSFFAPGEDVSTMKATKDYTEEKLEYVKFKADANDASGLKFKTTTEFPMIFEVTTSDPTFKTIRIRLLAFETDTNEFRIGVSTQTTQSSSMYIRLNSQLKSIVSGKPQTDSVEVSNAVSIFVSKHLEESHLKDISFSSREFPLEIRMLKPNITSSKEMTFTYTPDAIPGIDKLLQQGLFHWDDVRIWYGGKLEFELNLGFKNEEGKYEKSRISTITFWRYLDRNFTAILKATAVNGRSAYFVIQRKDYTRSTSGNNLTVKVAWVNEYGEYGDNKEKLEDRLTMSKIMYARLFSHVVWRLFDPSHSHAQWTGPPLQVV